MESCSIYPSVTGLFHSRLTHVVANGRISFFWGLNIPLCVCLCVFVCVCTHPWWLMMLSTFSYTCWPFVCFFFEKCLFRSFVHFLIELFGFFVTEFLVYFRNSLLIRYTVCKYFLPFHRLPFYSVDVSFAVQKLFIFLFFIYFWLCWVFLAAHGLSLVAASRGYSSLRSMGFSLRWLLLLQSTGSRCVGFSSCGTRAPERRLSSCGARA